MKQLLILSGKGGTGKTTVASAFIKLAQAQAYADCDVDAPNLHLVTRWNNEPTKTDYYGMPKAVINQDLCVECDRCRQECRFDAISYRERYVVDPFACEGCGVCVYVCDVDAVSLEPAIAGELMLFSDADRTFSTAQLKMGSGTSGMLVTEVKKRMKAAAPDTDVAIIDGSPGIGCPVIASLSGVDLTVIVTEPSVSGIHDMERIITTAGKFGVPVSVCINKYDTNLAHSERIERFCAERGLFFSGRIPFDPQAVQAINAGHSVVDIECPSGDAIRNVYHQTMGLLHQQDADSTRFPLVTS